MTAALDLQPTLAGPGVVLRPLGADDWDALFAVAADPLLWAQHPQPDRWREPVFRDFFAQGLASGGALVAVDPADGAVIGSSRFDPGRAGPGEVEIGWSFLIRRHWGGATNRAVKALMVGHALAACDRVVFVVGESNGRSRRAMEKLGAVLTDRTLVADLGGVPVRHVVYALDHVPAGPG